MGTAVDKFHEALGIEMFKKKKNTNIFGAAISSKEGAPKEVKVKEHPIDDTVNMMRNVLDSLELKSEEEEAKIFNYAINKIRDKIESAVAKYKINHSSDNGDGGAGADLILHIRMLEKKISNLEDELTMHRSQSQAHQWVESYPLPSTNPNEVRWSIQEPVQMSHPGLGAIMSNGGDGGNGGSAVGASSNSGDPLTDLFRNGSDEI